MFLRSVIPLLCLDYTIEYRLDFLRATLQYMELDSFVSLVLQYFIVILSDAIEYCEEFKFLLTIIYVHVLYVRLHTSKYCTYCMYSFL